MENVEHDLSRYAVMVQALARHAIGLAVDASPHQPKAGEVRVSLTHLLPAARQLVGDPGPALDAPPAEPSVTYTDGRGQTRPIYRPFAAYLHARAAGDFPAYENAPDTPDTPDVSRQLWAAWHRIARGEDVVAEVNRVVHAHPDCLHPQSLDETPDHWTYRELVGLHALHALIQLTDTRDDLPAQPGWRQRLFDITNYHQHHTQPDYTTYQPWGLAAFLSNPGTIMFAEQQLHDTQSHLQIEGAAGALLPALLLADAYASLAGR